MKIPKIPGAGSDLASVLTSRVLGMAIQMLTFVFLARAATPGAFGVYSKTYSYLLVLVGLSDLGVQALLGREFAVPEKRAWGRKVYWLQALLTGTTTLVMSVVLALGTEHGAVEWLIPWQVFIEIQQACTLALALAAGEARVQVRTMFLSRFPVLVAMAAAVALGIEGFPAVLLYLAVAITSTGLAVGWILVHLGILRDFGLPEDWRATLRESRHFLLSSASWQVRQLDTALVGWAANAQQAAFYAVPARLVGPLRLFDTSLTAVVVPYVRRGEHDRVRKFNRLMVIAVVGMSVAFVVVGLFLTPLVRLVLGERYLPTVGPLRMMLAATAALMAANYITAVIQAAGHERFVGLQGTALAALFVVIVPLGAHFLQATGAAAAVLVVNLLQFLTSVVVARTVFREFREPGPLLPEHTDEPRLQRGLLPHEGPDRHPDPKPRRAAD